LQNGFNETWEYTGELFEMNEVDAILIKTGVALDLGALRPQWEKEVFELLDKAHIKRPETSYMQTGSRKGLHSEHLGHLLAEMQALPRMHPEAKW
jgi:ring-1,2-phenylacetyl-CoA epoxidase subunit PaaC